MTIWTVGIVQHASAARGHRPGRCMAMSPKRSNAKRPKERSDNVVILYAILFCILLVVYIRYIM
jgi:hypothetical protein